MILLRNVPGRPWLLALVNCIGHRCDRRASRPCILKPPLLLEGVRPVATSRRRAVPLCLLRPQSAVALLNELDKSSMAQGRRYARGLVIVVGQVGLDGADLGQSGEAANLCPKVLRCERTRARRRVAVRMHFQGQGEVAESRMPPCQPSRQGAWRVTSCGVGCSPW